MRRVLFASILCLTVAVPAQAHEKRKVGDYDFVVGFLNEPAFSKQPNAVDLKVSKNGTPVEGLEKTVQVAVSIGDASRELELRQRYGQTGSYAGYFIPSVSGNYSFRISGEIEGAKISEVFRAEDGKFSPVRDSTELLFP